MALGIDASAHKGAIKTGRPLSTVAVLGSGIDVVYPPAHRGLYNDIINAGTVISQFEPDSAPYPSNFLNRNRLVAGLASATIVIQATLKSGSLVTAKHSIEQGKDLYVIPGDIDDRRYEGSNKLIQQGAQLITGIDDLFADLGVLIQKKTEDKKLKGHPDGQTLQQQIIKILEEQGSVKVDAMVRQLGNITFEKELLELEIAGYIERLPGNVLKLS
jgi:DNA processing protein